MTAINPADIRVGDTVRRTIVSEPILVTEVSETLIKLGELSRFKRGTVEEKATYTWELIDRPVPKPAVGSKWKASDGTRYIFNGIYYILWLAGNGARDAEDSKVLPASWCADSLVPDTDA